MRVQRSTLLCLAAVASLTFAAGNFAFAQKSSGRGPSFDVKSSQPRGQLSNIGAVKLRNQTPKIGTGQTRGPTTSIAVTPTRGGYQGGYRGGYQGGGYRGGFGWGVAVPGVLMTLPQTGPSRGDVFIDDGRIIEGPRDLRPQLTNRRGPSGAPPASESRLVPDEVVMELSNSVSPQTVDALQRRFRLERLEQQSFQLTGTTFYRWRIPDRRSVASVVRAVEGDRAVASAQPNYLFMAQQNEAKTSETPSTEIKPEGDPAQYELAKLRLPQAHALASGDRILVAVIDSGIDAAHPDLAGAVVQSYDALATKASPHKHGTAIAGLIAARGKLLGAAPRAQILAIRAFDPAGTGAEGNTFSILKSLDWAAANGARVINMSFAGPNDPAVHRSLEAARKKGIVLVAAAGNAGAKSPPLYPAADANVIAVSATDADDKLFEQSNRGRHIAVAAPGAQLLVAITDGGYEVSSGTSYSAAEVSGIVALMLERRSDLTPDQVRRILQATAKDLGPKGHDIMFGAGLADAYAAVMAEPAPPPALAANPRPMPIERVSTGAR
ncbi:MAG: S8 family serine peptidase [Rhizobiales bacterium]|nr:S8 family serine peptidase [Hyphomicrobiales bacterium]